ncbi:MAG TPA: choice-of-anchor D domain-containing protein [Usitatibacter sp.]|nr:choice-of-anchor D domain-containing protein [Usitatibacter sp.]
MRTLVRNAAHTAAVLIATLAAAFAPPALATPYLDLYFGGGSVFEIGQPIQLVVQFNDYDGTGYTGNLNLVTLSSGLVNGNAFSTTCAGAIVDALPGASSFKATNIAVAPNTSCQIYLQVEASLPGLFTVDINANAFVSSAGNNTVPYSAVLTVTPPMAVTHTGDSGVGSLREAINNANAFCYTTIRFEIAAPGPHTIRPLSQLPPITCNTNIDGFSQWDAAPDDGAGGGALTSDIRIELDGSLCVACDGLIAESNLFVSGLAIRSFTGAALRSRNYGALEMWENYIGTDAGGMNAYGNGIGVIAEPSSRLSIQYGNLITGNGTGVVMDNFNANVSDSLIGGRRDGSAGIGNGVGIRLSNGYYGVDRNYIRHNTDRGLVIATSAAEGTWASGNSIWGNGGTGIDVGDDGYTAPSETTPYPFNPPFITSATWAAGTGRVIGYLKTVPNRDVTIEIYHNSAASLAGNTNGERHVATLGARTDASGFAAFDGTFGLDTPLANVSALALADVCNEGCYATSEFSPTINVTVPVDRSAVTNTNDSGVGSLRDAIEYVNYACSPKALAKPLSGVRALFGAYNITFNIPGTGVHTIRPLSPLPPITCDALVLDGFTQPGSKPNGLSIGDDAARLIELDGSLAPVLTNGLEIAAPNVVIRGLVINNFASGAGIMVLTPSGAAAPSLTGNVIGTDPGGTARRKNAYGIRNAASAASVLVGGPFPDQRNIISGNDAGVQLESGSSSQVENNYIGMNPAGNSARPNDNGIILTNASYAAITGNVISGNLGAGIWLQSNADTTITRNLIGTDASGAGAAPNGSEGVDFWNASTGWVGGPFGSSNTIAYNGRHGVRVRSNAVRLQSNSIYQNGGLGIELDNAGVVAPNDSCDADSGGNGWQNFPVLASVIVMSDFTRITGTFDSTGGRTFTLEFFRSLSTDAAGNRAGRAFIGSTDVATTLTPSCATPFTVDLATVLAPGDLVTATATDKTANATGWFSAAVPAAVAGPGAGLSPASLAFGGQVVNTSSAPQQVTFTNVGTTTLTITSINIGAYFSFSAPSCGATLAPLASCTIDVTFTPTIAAAVGTALLIATNAPGSPHRVDLTGTGMPAPAPLMTLTPSSLAFSPQLIGSPSAAQVVTLSNTGTATMTVSSISVTGDYSQAHACPNSLPVGASCTIDVKFIPTAAGARPGSLKVTSNAAGNPHTVSISGTGVTPAPIASITPSSLSFAARTVGTTSTAQTLTLANTGTLALAITRIAVTGDFAFTSGCAATLAPGASCAIDVTFTPLAIGARNGTLTITDNAAGSPHTVALDGVGLSTAVPVADLSATLIDFPAEPVGSESAPEVVTVTNSGNAPLTFTSIGVTGEFALVAPAGAPTALQCPVTLGPGTSCEIRVVFRPMGPNLRQGTLAIVTNAGTVNVRVIGTGYLPAPPQLSLPSSLAFGNQAVGTTGAGRALAIRNTSEFVATLTTLSASGDFHVSDTCTTIAPGATCSPLVTFQPSAVGPRTGTLTVRTLRDASPYAVELSGTGEDRREPVLQLSATGIGFGNTFMGQPITRDLAVQNTGTAPLTITSILTRGAFFTDTGCITTLPPGAACTVRVSFLASLPGSQAASLDISSNAAGSPHHVGLSGTGCFIPTPSRIRLGGVLCGP